MKTVVQAQALLFVLSRHIRNYLEPASCFSEVLRKNAWSKLYMGSLGLFLNAVGFRLIGHRMIGGSLALMPGLLFSYLRFRRAIAFLWA